MFGISLSDTRQQEFTTIPHSPIKIATQNLRLNHSDNNAALTAKQLKQQKPNFKNTNMKLLKKMCIDLNC